MLYQWRRVPQVNMIGYTFGIAYHTRRPVLGSFLFPTFHPTNLPTYLPPSLPIDPSVPHLPTFLYLPTHLPTHLVRGDEEARCDDHAVRGLDGHHAGQPQLVRLQLRHGG